MKTGTSGIQLEQKSDVSHMIFRDIGRSHGLVSSNNDPKTKIALITDRRVIYFELFRRS